MEIYKVKNCLTLKMYANSISRMRLLWWRNVNAKILFSIFFGLISMIFFVLWYPRILASESNNEIILYSNSRKIAVVVVIEKENQTESYLLAKSTMECYCKIYGYKLFQIVMDKSPEMQNLCSQDIFFQRICVTMRILQQNPEIEYLFFFDADVGVINPKHRLEDYINPKYDLSFYERIYFYDIMSGSFVVKNTKYSMDFLQEWLTFDSHYGSNDQAALHQVFLNRYFPNHPQKEKCEKEFTPARPLRTGGTAIYAACARWVMNGTLEFDKVIIYPKRSHKTMVRDVWLTRSEWAPRDFMFHDLEQYKITNDVEKLEKNPIWSYFPNPFLSDAIFHSSLCQMPDGLSCWKYNSTFIKNDTYIDKILQQRADEIKQQYLDTINSIKSSKSFL